MIFFGPVQSFKSVYESNLNKRRKKKHEPFEKNKHGASQDLIYEEQPLSESLKNEIRKEAQLEKRSTQIKAFVATLVTTLIFGLGIYWMMF